LAFSIKRDSGESKPEILLVVSFGKALYLWLVKQVATSAWQLDSKTVKGHKVTLLSSGRGTLTNKLSNYQEHFLKYLLNRLLHTVGKDGFTRLKAQSNQFTQHKTSLNL